MPHNQSSKFHRICNKAAFLACFCDQMCLLRELHAIVAWSNHTVVYNASLANSCHSGNFSRDLSDLGKDSNDNWKYTFLFSLSMQHSSAKRTSFSASCSASVQCSHRSQVVSHSFLIRHMTHLLLDYLAECLTTKRKPILKKESTALVGLVLDNITKVIRYV